MLKWMVEAESLNAGYWAKVSGRRGQEFRAPTRRELFDQIAAFLDEVAGPDEPIAGFQPTERRRPDPPPPLEPVVLPPSRVVVRPVSRRTRRVGAR